MREHMTFYESYKPFRNYMRRFELVASLIDIWRYALHIIDGQDLPADYATGKPNYEPVSKYIYPWDLETLSRELVLNACDLGDRSLRRWTDLAPAVNHIRRLDGCAYVLEHDVMFELHRIAHRQFPWQTDMGVNPMMRAFKVFGERGVEAIVQREMGMTARQFLQLGMAVGGHFSKRWGMSTNQDYAVLGISRDASDAFFKRLTCTIAQLRAATSKRQSYDRDWLYVWNPLEATPLISFDLAFPDRVLCPIPRFLTLRASAGIFYDLVKSADFDNPFGSSFQSYVGEILAATCPHPRFTILTEEPYYVGSQQMHGADWVLSDRTGHVFIEAKTKRLTVNAKTLSDTAALDRDLSVMAAAIVQNYRNIGDALDRRTRWVPDGLPIYPLILTLEDWFIFYPGCRRNSECACIATAVAGWNS